MSQQGVTTVRRTQHDFAGTLAAVGDGVTRFAVGDAVFGVVTKPFSATAGSVST
jgi:NADPH:quinone reductase-like Zn-dependent oxidoreductase